MRNVTSEEELARRLAAEAISGGEPTGWFERIYAAAAAGQSVVPWDRGMPHRLLTEWAADTGLSGRREDGRRSAAVVVGCGLGDDAEFVEGLGFAVTAFDISPTAVQGARQRFPGSAVRYQVADLLQLPGDWRLSFDLVVESMTLQALPDPPRAAAIAQVGTLVAPGGTLLVIARGREPDEPDDGPPWALTSDEIEALTEPGLRVVSTEDLRDTDPPARRWRAVLHRPS
jgi:SAM-dependent methyltransferase